MEMTVFLEELSSKAPTPGGGGASALVGAVGAALCSMVGNLTTGKKTYAAYEADIGDVLAKAAVYKDTLYALIDKDAQAFAPLAAAYGIPKDAPDRDTRMEAALLQACEPPMEMLREVTKVIALCEVLLEKGSRLAVSDVAVAAAACRCALHGAVMNVYINTKSMLNREAAAALDAEAAHLVADGTARCDAVYEAVLQKIQG